MKFCGNIFKLLLSPTPLSPSFPYWEKGISFYFPPDLETTAAEISEGEGKAEPRQGYTVPKVFDFPRYNRKYSGQNEILRGIFHVVSRFPVHFALYLGNLDYFL